MRDSEKSKGQLIKELEGLRARVAQMDIRQADDRKTLKAPWGSEEVLSAVFSSVMDGIVVTDLEGRIAEVNDVLVEYSGYSKEEIIGQEAFRFFSEEERDSARINWMGLLPPGRISTKCEYAFVNARGEKYPVEVNTSVIHDGFGNPFGFVGVIRNITEQKQIEHDLKKQHAELQLILDSVPALIYYKDKDGRLINMNKATASLTRVPKEKLLDKTVSQLMPDSADRYRKDDMEVITSGRAKMNIEEPLELPDKKMWLKTDKLPIKDENGNVIGLVGFSVDITERKMAEEALRQSQEELSAVFDAIGDVVLVTDTEGRIVDINSLVKNVFGYEKKDVIGRIAFELIAPEHRETAIQEMARAVSEDFIGQYRNYKLISSDGRLLDCEVVTSKIKDSAGNLRGFVGVIRDVTQRKKMEDALRQSEERYRLIAENMSDVIWIMDLDFRYQYVSPSIEHMRGFTPDEAMGMMAWEYMSEDSLKTSTKRLTTELDLEKIGGADPDRVTTMDLEVKKKDGSWMWIEVKVTFLRDNEGRPIGLLGVSRDITERKQIQEVLRDSEEKLRVIFNSMGDAATIVDLRDNIVDCNEEAVRLHGFGSKEELIGRKASELVATVDRDRAVKDAIGALKKPYISGRSEYKLLTKDGREFDGEFGVSVLKGKSGKPAGFIGLAYDISDRKKAAEALRQSEEKLRLMFNSMMDGVVVTNMQLDIVDVNEAAVSFSGYSRDELIGKSGIMLLPTNDRERSIDIVSEIVQSKNVQEKHEHTFVRTDDTKLDIEVSTSVLRDSSDNPVGLVNVVRDITERKRMEGELRKSEEKYRDLVEKERDVIFAVDALGFITSINPAVKGWGYTTEEIIGKNFIELVPEDWREKTAIELQNALLASGELTAETRVIHKNGQVLPIEYSAMIIKEEGQYAGVQGVVRDMSERKKAEEALRQSEEKFRVMFESIPDGITVIDLKSGKIADSNPASLFMLGFGKDEVIGQEAFNFIAEKDRMRAFDDMQRTLTRGGSATAEWRLVGRGGREFDCEATTAVIKDSSGAPAFMVNVMRDVTERRRIEKELDEYRNNLERMVQERTSELIKANKNLKYEVIERQRAEDELRASEEKLRLIFDSIGEGIIVTDLNGVVKNLNDDAVRMVGYDRKEEVIGRSSLEPIVEADRERAVRDMMRMIESGIGLPSEYRFCKKDGREFYGELRGAVLRDSKGSPAELLGVFRDITERKNAEEALRSSEEKYRFLTEKMNDVVWTMDIDLYTTYVSPSISRVLGFTPEERLKQEVREQVTPDSLQVAIKVLTDELAREGKEGVDPNRSIILEMEYYRKDSTTVWMESVITGIRDNRGKLIGLHGVSRDITERRKAEQALRESEARSRAILDAMPDLIFQMDRQGVFIGYKGPTEGLYVPPEEFVGRNIKEILPVEVAERTLQTIKRTLDTGSVQQYSYELQIEGKTHYFDVRMSSINKEVALALVRDITERRIMEDALKVSEGKLRGMFNSIKDGVALTDLEFTILEANDAALDLSGYESKEELIGTKGYTFFPADTLASSMSSRDEAVEGRPVPRDEYKIVNKLGRQMYVDVGVSMYKDPSGKQAGFVAVVKDITEHKHMEDALRDSEEKLRIMFASIADGVVVTDLEGKIYDVNAAQLRMFGFKEKEEVIGSAGFEFISEQDRERAFKDMAAIFSEGHNIGTYAMVDRQGREFEAELSSALLHDAAGKPTGFITVMRDVTERRRMERALRDSEEKLRIIFESIGDGIVVTDLEGLITETNEAAAKLGGWSDKGQLIGLSGFDFVAENERGKMIADMIRALKEQRSINVEYAVKDKVGKEYQSEVNVTLLRDAMGNPKGIVSVIRDVTERKRMEQDLRDSEEMSRGMLESAATAVCIVKDGKFAYVSPMFAEMTGYAVDELIGMVSAAYIHEKDRDSAMREAVANLKGESTAPHEYRLLRKDGSFIWILEKIASIQYKGERAAIGSLLDITRLKRVEEALRDSEEKLRLIFASLPDGVTVTDMNGKIIEENDAGIKLSGFTSKEQVIGLNGFDFIAVSDRRKALLDLPKIFEKDVSGPLEYKMIMRDGTEYDGEVIASMMRDKDGNPQGFITVVRNVTERRKAEEALKESREMMRGMIDSAASGIYLVQDGKFEYVNPLFSGISGYTSEELIGSDSMSYIHPDDRDVARMKAIENLKGINDLPHEFRFIRKNGQSTWILEKVASIEYKGRRAAIGSFMDISESKRIEEVLVQRSRELEQRTSQLLALQKITASIQSTLDLKEILQQVANGVVHNLGFDHALIIKVDETAKVARGMVFATKDDMSKVGEVQKAMSRRLIEIEIPQVRGHSKVVDDAMDGKATITHDFFDVASAILTREESDALAKLMGVKTAVVMPLFARDRHVGSILTLTKQEEIGAILLEPLRILSDQAGFAIENADLYHGVTEYAKRLSVISALSKILGSSLDIKGVYSAFTEEIRKVMSFDRSSIAMVEGDQLRYFVVEQEVDTVLKNGAALPLSDSATGLVVKTKRTIIEPDFDKEMKFPIDHMYHQSGLRSAIRVPLFYGGEVFATFNLASKKPNAYGDREKEILEQISGSLTAAIENSRLFDQVKQHESELLKAYEDLKSAQEYMLQAEKLRALGEMAGGVAHDFNNVLAVVLGRTQLALEDVKDEKLKKDLQIIEQTAVDAATTVRRLQDFARVRVERNFEVLDLREVVEGALQMAESRRVKLKEREGINIDIESKMHEAVTVEGDAAELREALLNIIFNAVDAMPKGGKITVEDRKTEKWVTIAISDTGIGIPEEIRTKIFEPFFTTRTHKGTGLGLSVTYSIIQRHRGEISVESKVGVGSTFHIKLPVCEGVVSKKHVAGKADAVKGISILMVDDNPEVAGILSLTLRRLGHTVVEANSGESAINTFEVGKFDLVITDLGMPDMSGYEVAKIVKEIKPGTPVLVISGWGGQLNLDEMPEVDGVIAKPFSKEVLSEKIAAVLSCEGAQARDLKQKADKTKKASKGGSGGAAEGLTGKGEKPKKKKGPDKKG